MTCHCPGCYSQKASLLALMQVYRQTCAQANITPHVKVIRAIQQGIKSESFTGLELKLSLANINETSLSCLVNALIQVPIRIETLDLSFNKLVQDQSLRGFIGYLENKASELFARFKGCNHSQFILNNLNLEKTLITSQTANQILKLMPSLNLKSLNLASTKLSSLFFQNLNDLLEMTDVFLKQLNLQNTKLPDKYGITLFQLVISRTQIEDLNLRQNQLGFKMGQAAIQTLQQAKSQVYLQRIGLEFNLMSEQMKVRVGQELSKHISKERMPFKEVQQTQQIVQGRNQGENLDRRQTSISQFDLKEIHRRRSDILNQRNRMSQFYQPQVTRQKSICSNRSFVSHRNPSQLILKKPQIMSSNSFLAQLKSACKTHLKNKSSCDFDLMIKTGQLDNELLKNIGKGSQNTQRNKQSSIVYKTERSPGPFRFIVRGNLNNIQAYETAEINADELNQAQNEEIETVLNFARPNQPADNVSEVLTNYSIRPPSQTVSQITEQNIDKMIEGGQIGELSSFLRSEIARFTNILVKIEENKIQKQTSGQGSIQDRPSSQLEQNLKLLRTRLIDV